MVIINTKCALSQRMTVSMEVEMNGGSREMGSGRRKGRRRSTEREGEQTWTKEESEEEREGEGEGVKEKG